MAARAWYSPVSIKLFDLLTQQESHVFIINVQNQARSFLVDNLWQILSHQLFPKVRLDEEHLQFHTSHQSF